MLDYGLIKIGLKSVAENKKVSVANLIKYTTMLLIVLIKITFPKKYFWGISCIIYYQPGF